MFKYPPCSCSSRRGDEALVDVGVILFDFKKPPRLLGAVEGL